MSDEYAPVMVRGLVATLTAVKVEVQVDADVVLGVRMQVPVIRSVASEEDTETMPNGLKVGLYNSASEVGVPPLVRPITSTCPLFSCEETRPLSAA